MGYTGFERTITELLAARGLTLATLTADVAHSLCFYAYSRYAEGRTNSAAEADAFERVGVHIPKGTRPASGAWR